MQLSALGMGCMRLPVVNGDDAAVDQAAVEKMVALAMERGVNYYDTAWGYHAGHSEEAIGRALAAYPREQFCLADKFPGYDLGNMGKVQEIFEAQLKKCQVSYFDFYLFHNVCEMNIDYYLDPQYGILSYLLEQKRNGRIRHLGFSCHGTLPVLKRFLEAYGQHMEFCQLQLNYIDWVFQGGKEKVALLAQYGTVYSPLDPDLVCIAEAGDEYFPESMGFEYQQEEENVLSMILSFDGKALPSRDLRYKVGYFRHDGAEEPDKVGGQGAGSAAFLEFELPDHTDLNETFTFDHPGALAGREIERATFTFTPLQTVVEVVYVDAKEDELVWADVDVLVLDEAGERIPATSTSLLSSGVDALETVPDVLYLQAGDPSSNEGVGIGEPLAFTFK